MRRLPSRLVALVAASLLVAGGLTLDGPAGTTPSAVARAQIEISNFAYSPARLVVTPGQRVTVTNTDAVDHTVTAANGAFATGNLSKGQSASFLAPRRPGAYDYYCGIHQFMQGVLVVK